jgi:hypothetical protein
MHMMNNQPEFYNSNLPQPHSKENKSSNNHNQNSFTYPHSPYMNNNIINNNQNQLNQSTQSKATTKYSQPSNFLGSYTPSNMNDMSMISNISYDNKSMNTSKAAANSFNQNNQSFQSQNNPYYYQMNANIFPNYMNSKNNQPMVGNQDYLVSHNNNIKPNNNMPRSMPVNNYMPYNNHGYIQNQHAHSNAQPPINTMQPNNKTHIQSMPINTNPTLSPIPPSTPPYPMANYIKPTSNQAYPGGIQIPKGQLNTKIATIDESLPGKIYYYIAIR